MVFEVDGSELFTQIKQYVTFPSEEIKKKSFEPY